MKKKGTFSEIAILAEFVIVLSALSFLVFHLEKIIIFSFSFFKFIYYFCIKFSKNVI